MSQKTLATNKLKRKGGTKTKLAGSVAQDPVLCSCGSGVRWEGLTSHSGCVKAVHSDGCTGAKVEDQGAGGRLPAGAHPEVLRGVVSELPGLARREDCDHASPGRMAPRGSSVRDGVQLRPSPPLPLEEGHLSPLNAGLPALLWGPVDALLQEGLRSLPDTFGST